MLFKSMGVAVATHTSSADDLKPVTIRLSETEVQVYDVVAKTMGLNRQDFLTHLIRDNFRPALKEFVLGYTSSNPTVPLIDVLKNNAENDEIKSRIHSLLNSISHELKVEDEEAFLEFEKNGGGDFVFASERNGIFKVSK